MYLKAHKSTMSSQFLKLHVRERPLTLLWTIPYTIADEPMLSPPLHTVSLTTSLSNYLCLGKRMDSQNSCVLNDLGRS